MRSVLKFLGIQRKFVDISTYIEGVIVYVVIATTCNLIGLSIDEFSSLIVVLVVCKAVPLIVVMMIVIKLYLTKKILDV